MYLKILSLPLLAATFLSVAGCSTPTVVTLQNGTEYITRDTPQTHSADGFYEFKDISGKEVRVKASDVATVKPKD
ncbi:MULTISPECIES: YgdI/YgdR family lipoprotein [Pseudomonas]|uniref:YgdI/YgdR family lipoprotein n=1 Tax=Pseudomonas gingeri TaxID=117681 RepID=A0A7Y7WM28_9PSED|nr:MULTISPECIES: YgdI/YgdR family lipoprotein [Pseudomonas]NWB83680.1 YgdI/YgdR family lipoprotein [Pseudomonas gingeri]RBH53835.1 YgdI/YgdR family lipoprotein [Pseudomonas sp. MWU13-2860]